MLAPKCPNKSNREGLHTNGFDNGLRLRLPLPENHYEPASAAPVPTRASSLLTSSAITVSSDTDLQQLIASDPLSTQTALRFHRYLDKFLLVEFLTNSALASQ